MVLKSIHAYYTVCMQVLSQSVMDPHAEDWLCLYRIIADKEKKILSKKTVLCSIFPVLAIEFYHFHCPLVHYIRFYLGL